jgi:hypothetical protein
MLVGALLLGCASAPMSGGPVYDPELPQIFLANAEPDQVMGVAMGAAITNGWKIVESKDSMFVQQRPLNAAAAEAIAPGASLATLPAVVEVRSQFFPRMGGVDVVLDAQAVVHRGSEDERREDFTETYRAELMQSLGSLRQAWSETRQRIASAIPPLPPESGEQQPEEAEGGTAFAAATQVDTAVASAPQDESADNPVQTAWGSGSPPARPPAPVESRLSRPSPQPLAVTEPLAVAQTPPDLSAVDSAGNMMALKEPPSLSTGVWAYYAEHYARVRGCELAGQGAVLIEKTPAYEQHRVYCEGGQTFLVKCNAGTCRGVR